MSNGNLLAYGTDVVYSGNGGSGSGGHTIENSSGTDLTQRDTLKFAGTLKATDDSTNEKTVISDAAEEVEWSVWNEMTEEERDAYSAGKKIDIVNVPGADGTIDADLMTLLWTNPSPTAAFAGQTVALDLSDYDFVRIVFSRYSSHDAYGTFDFEKNGGKGIASMVWDQNTQDTVRVILGISDSGIQFGDGQANDKSTNNAYMVPTRIYGIKKTINLKINAIASDVSTSASKCMLSDGETSVEDVIDRGYVEVTGNGSKTLKQLFDELWPLIDLSKVTKDSVLEYVGGSDSYYSTLMFKSNVSLCYASVMFITTGTTDIYSRWIAANSASSGTITRIYTSVSVTDNSTTVIPNGAKFRLYY